MAPTFKTTVLTRRIKRFENAAVALSWKGGQPPEDREQIEREYKAARLALWNYIIEHAI